MDTPSARGHVCMALFELRKWMNDMRGGVLSLSFGIENELILLALADELEATITVPLVRSIFCASKNGVKTTASSENFKEQNRLYGGFEPTRMRMRLLKN